MNRCQDRALETQMHLEFVVRSFGFFFVLLNFITTRVFVQLLWRRLCTTTATKHHAPSPMLIAVTTVPGTDAGPDDLYVWAQMPCEHDAGYR